MKMKRAYRQTNLKNSRVRIWMIIVAVLPLSILLMGVADAKTTVSKCTSISSPGEYILDRDIVVSSDTDSSCIYINSSNVIFDGGGFTISTDGLHELNYFVSGVKVNDITATTGLTDVTVKNLKVKNWKKGGIEYYNVTNGTIENINASNNEWYGIALDFSSYSNVSGNIVEGNGFSGIHITDSNNNMMSGNIATSNFNEGISMERSSYNMVVGNNATSNTHPIAGGGTGIYLGNSSYNNISGNIAEANGFSGIDLSYYSNNNAISGNTVNSNGDEKSGTVGAGISLSGSSNNMISDNIATSNFGKGIELIYYSNDNLIYNNYFSNVKNVRDEGNNTWNITKTKGTNILGGPNLGGNYWSDYTGKDTDGDGLGNTLIPYTSSGNIMYGGDYLPLEQRLEIPVKIPPIPKIPPIKLPQPTPPQIKWTQTIPPIPEVSSMAKLLSQPIIPQVA